MQEYDADLIEEDRLEKAGYYDWLSDSIDSLKADYMMTYDVKDLIDHFYWNENTIEEFWEFHQDSFSQYCGEQWDGLCEVEETDNYYKNRY